MAHGGSCEGNSKVISGTSEGRLLPVHAGKLLDSIFLPSYSGQLNWKLLSRAVPLNLQTGVAIWI